MAKEFNKNKLPKNWIWVELGDILETTSGGTPSRERPDYYNGAIPWVKSGELNYNIILKTEESITEDALSNSSAKLFPKGTLLIALYGATVGRLAFLGIGASTNQAVCGIFQNKNIVIKFIYYCLMNQYSYLISLSAGGAQPNISQTIIKKINVPLPPFNEQNRIVLKLDELLSELEKGKEQLQTSLGQLKVYKQSILKHVFDGKWTETHANNKDKKYEWLSATLQEVCSEITDGSHFSPKANSKGYPYITVKDIKNDRIDFENSLRISKDDFDKLVYNGCKPNKGDVLFSKDGTVGKVSLIDYEKEFVVLSSIAILRTNTLKIESRLLFYALKSTHFLNQALDQKKGVAIRRIILRDLKSLKLRYPKEKKVQHKLIGYLDSTFEAIESLENDLSIKVTQSEVLKQSLLQKAFEGKLVEQDSNDVPAVKLLERIIREREEFLNTEKERKIIQKKPMKKIRAVKLFEFPLLDAIKEKFGNKKFTFDQLKSEVDLNYDVLREELFSLLDNENVLTMEFDQKNELMNFKYIGK